MPVQKIKQSTNVLSIDIGGTSVKGCILSKDGDMVTDFIKVPTPKKSTPEAIINCIKEILKSFNDDFNKVSIGFPGYVKKGIVETAPNLAKNSWLNVDLAQQVSNLLNLPVRLINDADQQALGIVSGKGFEIVLTVGTGFGTALVYDGELLPHLELAHLPVTKKKDYDSYIGTEALEEFGIKKWNERVQRIIQIYKTVFNYDTLYIGGGNSKHIDFELDHNIKLVTNRDGIKGGAKLWQVAEKYHVYTIHPQNNK
ncbi:MAG: ROK family protein [Pedobacter sp.]|nr:ROK family protein [Pedobacter sp.]